MSIAEAEKYIGENQFAPGSMLPKVQAAIAFAQSGEVRLECRQQEAGSVYELQRALGFDRFNDLTVDFQLVAQSHECFFSNFHFIFF